jgi:hypothetical protein
MTRRLRWLCVPSAFILVVGLCSVAVGADRTKVDQATRRVEQGAKQIGQGEIGPGFKEMFTGIGHTIVEGAKFSGNTISEFFNKTSGDSSASPDRK